MTQTSAPQPPVVSKKPFRIETHGDVRIDDYFWLREKENSDVIALLNAENAYTEAMLAPEKNLRETLFEEMKARLKEDDAEVPYRKGEYFYYSRMEPGRQYAISCRKKGSLDAPEEILLDGNVLAEGQKYFKMGVFDVSPDHQWLAYSVDNDGGEKYTLYFKNLKTGELSPESIPGTYYSCEWGNDNKTVFYTLLDANDRPDRLVRHTLGTDPATDVVLFKENDPSFFVGCSKSRSERYIFLESAGKITSEIYFLDADQPTGDFKVIEPRRRGIEYDVTHHGDHFYIVTNDQVQNFRLVKAPVSNPGAVHWVELRRGSPTLFIRAAEAFKGYLLLHEREQGLMQIRVLDMLTQEEHRIEFPEPAYTIGGAVNAEFDTEVYRFSYTSLITPQTVFDYNLRTRAREVKKTQEIPSGYDRTQYRSERILAKSHDGTLVPISLVYRLDANGSFHKNGSHPLYLYGYGSYGFSMDPSFSITRLSLLDRGFVFAMAHIRGGSEMGRPWYDNGKFLQKKNTFLDFIATAEELIAQGFTRKGEITIVGGSAGGMLVGATANLRPELFKAVVAHVPFVDVINTMLDETLPLTALEYEEWGNPGKDSEYYHYMKTYSPYDNVERKAYPHMFVTSGLNDPRVTYWEPAKWVAKLRELKTDSNLLLQHINMGAGHGGASGRYERLKEVAMEQAFLLKVYGLS